MTEWTLALWTLASICWAWGAIDLMHSYFEAHEFDTDRERKTVQSLRKVRAEHDSFGFGTSADDPDLPTDGKKGERQ